MRDAAYKLLHLVPKQDDRRVRVLDVERTLVGTVPVRQQRHLAVEAHAVVVVPRPRAVDELHHAPRVAAEASALQVEHLDEVEHDVVGVVALVDGRVPRQQVDDEAFARPGVHDLVVRQRRAAEGVDLDAGPVRDEVGGGLLAVEDEGEAGFLHVRGGEGDAAVVFHHADVELQGRVEAAVGFDVHGEDRGPDGRALVIVDHGVRQLQVYFEVDAAVRGPPAQLSCGLRSSVFEECRCRGGDGDGSERQKRG